MTEGRLMRPTSANGTEIKQYNAVDVRVNYRLYEVEFGIFDTPEALQRPESFDTTNTRDRSSPHSFQFSR